MTQLLSLCHKKLQKTKYNACVMVYQIKFKIKNKIKQQQIQTNMQNIQFVNKKYFISKQTSLLCSVYLKDEQSYIGVQLFSKNCPDSRRDELDEKKFYNYVYQHGNIVILIFYNSFRQHQLFQNNFFQILSGIKIGICEEFQKNCLDRKLVMLAHAKQTISKIFRKEIVQQILENVIDL